MEILVQNEGVRYFMNNAMMALETVTTSPWASGSGQDEATLAQEALEACVSCNFSKAYIAEIVKKAVFTKK